MSVEDISAVSAWLATQPVKTGTPAERMSNKLPLECGSYPQEGQAR